MQERAAMLKAVRAFFDSRGCMEVDTPLLSPYAPIDIHIDPIETAEGFLHTSPEYHMKRLLAEGSGDIYQLSHVYRKEEEGRLHSTVFTMIEWYRVDISYSEFLQEIIALTELFVGKKKVERLTYQEAFQQTLTVDPFATSTQELLNIGRSHNLYLNDQPIDDLLNELWGCLIEPILGKDVLTIIEDYPPSQAALAKVIDRNGRPVAQRFEVYIEGIELGNGYHELSSSSEQQIRLEKANRERVLLGKKMFTIDPHFVEAVGQLPNCYGMAMGFDRLLMLKNKLNNIDKITYN